MVVFVLAMQILASLRLSSSVCRLIFWDLPSRGLILDIAATTADRDFSVEQKPPRQFVRFARNNSDCECQAAAPKDRPVQTDPVSALFIPSSERCPGLSRCESGPDEPFDLRDRFRDSVFPRYDVLR